MGLISVVLLYIYITLTGYYLGKIICHKNTGVLELISYGFVFHLAIVQLISIPCLVLKTTFMFFFGVYSVIMVGLLIAWYMVDKITDSIKEWIYCLRKKRLNRIKNDITVWLVFVLLVIIIQILYSSYMQYTDADDGHMTTVSTVAIKENRLDLSYYDVYDGTYTGKMRESFYSWEFFIAILSKLFRIHPAIVDHSVIIAPLIVLSYIVVFCILKLVFKEKKNQHLALFLYSILILLAGYSRYSRGCRVLLRVWQGKSVLACIWLPILLHSCLCVYKNDYSWRRWLINLAIIIAGTGSSVMGIYMLPIAYIVYGLPLVIYLFFRKQIKTIWLIIKRLTITMLPIIVLAGFVLYGAVSGNWGGDVIPTGQTEPDWMFTYKAIFTDSHMLFLLLAGIVVILIEYVLEKKQVKKTDVTVSIECNLRLTLVMISVALFLTFLNPILCAPVSIYITGIIVYWRLYWILPMDLIITVAMALIIGRIKKKYYKILIVTIMILLILFSGKYMYSKNLFFEPHENYYKIPQKVLTVSDYLLSEDENPVCFFPKEISYYPRQYDSHIIVIGARNFPNNDRIGDSDLSYSWLYRSIYVDKNLNDETVRWAIDELGVEYIYMDYAATAGTLLDKESFDEIYYDLDEIPGYGYVYSLK